MYNIMYSDAGSGSQGTNCTLILNGTDNSTDFSHSLGIYFTGCKCCECDSDCCVNGSDSEYNNMSYGMSQYCICKMCGVCNENAKLNIVQNVWSGKPCYHNLIGRTCTVKHGQPLPSENIYLVFYIFLW